MTRTVPALEIETEAVAQIGLRLAGGALAQVHLDYVRPGYGRHFELVGRNGVLAWDYVAGTVSLERAGSAPVTVHRVPEGFQRNDMFLDHMRRFLDRVQGRAAQAVSPLTDAVAVLRTALAAHQSSRERHAVDPRSGMIPGPAQA
jgi:predicted dehydrogenase